MIQRYRGLRATFWAITFLVIILVMPSLCLSIDDSTLKKIREREKTAVLEGRSQRPEQLEDKMIEQKERARINEIGREKDWDQAVEEY